MNFNFGWNKKYKNHFRIVKNIDFQYICIKTIYLNLLCTFIPVLILGQESDSNINKGKHNSVYIELLGNGIAPSINYERITANMKVNVGVRVGFGFSPENEYKALYTFPFEIVLVLFGSKKHHIEFGGGISYYLEVKKSEYYHDDEKHNDDSILIFPRIGYRFTGNKGLLIRVGYSPVLELPALENFEKPFSPWGGISIGYSF